MLIRSFAAGCDKCKEADFKKAGFFPHCEQLKKRRLGTSLPVKSHTSYLCSMRKLRMDELPRKSRIEFQRAEKLPVSLLLENIRSMNNVGSIFRTADAFLASGIFLCGYTPRPPHRDIHKTALGATETVEWKYSESALETIRDLKMAGYKIVGVEQVEGSIPLHLFKPPVNENLLLVFGNEVEGVSEDLLALCDICIEIPQFGMKHSLNVSVAAGMVMWEIVRSYARS